MHCIPLDHVRAYTSQTPSDLWFETIDGTDQAFYDLHAHRFVTGRELQRLDPCYRFHLDRFATGDGAYTTLTNVIEDIEGAYLYEWEENADAALASYGLRLGPIMDVPSPFPVIHYRLEPAY